jgi:hypothetical protein
MSPILAHADQPGNGAPGVYPACMTADDPAYPAPEATPETPAQYVPQAGYQPPPQMPYPYGYQLAPPTNGLAIASLVTSVAMLAFCFPLAVVGAILGHVARRQIRERGEGGDGLALAGIIIGWIALLVPLLFLAVIMAIGFSGGFDTPSCGAIGVAC